MLNALYTEAPTNFENVAKPGHTVVNSIFPLDYIRQILILFIIIMPNLSLADTLQNGNADWLPLSQHLAKRERYIFSAAEMATREHAPFLFYGAIVNASHPRWRQFERALQEHPDVLSCLTPKEAASDSFDLLHFDWSGPHDGPSLDVCLFRVLAALKEPALIADWFRYNGFRVSIFNDPTPSAPPSEHDSGQGFDASISSNAFHTFRSNWLYSLTGYDPAYNYTCSVRFSSSLSLSGVGCIGNVE